MSLLVIVLAGSLGAGYFLYGKREARGSFMLAGTALCVYPLLVNGAWTLLLVGIALAAAPFWLDF